MLHCSHFISYRHVRIQKILSGVGSGRGGGVCDNFFQSSTFISQRAVQTSLRVQLHLKGGPYQYFKGNL